MANQNEIREKITNTVIKALESGSLPPWRQPWKADKNAGLPANVVSKKNYRGINPWLLMISAMEHGFQGKWWGTYRQWEELGGQVKKRPEGVKSGEWGTKIIFYKPLVVKDRNDEDKEKKILILREYVVFNIDQVDGGIATGGDRLAKYRIGNETVTDSVVVNEEADHVIAATKADIRHGGNRAYYSLAGDYIQVPKREQFTRCGSPATATDSEYYETVFHELCHWTENDKRLDWKRGGMENTYSMGELIAEMGSCFLAAELGIIVGDHLPNHASYLEHWLKAMKSDTKFILQASSQASKAADFILAFSRPVEEEIEELEAA
jgi:antirestriction protein ArdC